jgi:hypothetical protein
LYRYVPDIAAKRLKCRLCPRVASFGCAAITQGPRGGWVCPQHVCHGCGCAAADRALPSTSSSKAGVNGAKVAEVLLRCVTCPKAFCDECSGGADFEVGPVQARESSCDP